MSLTRSLLNDFRPLFRLLEEPLHAPSFARFRPNARQPLILQRHTPVEFSEEGNDIVVRAEMPGVQKEHLDVRLENDGQNLSIEGKVRRASRVQVGAPVTESPDANSATGKLFLRGLQLNRTNYRSFLDVSKSTTGSPSQPEFRSSFNRKFWLPQPVNGSKATAELADGILTLRIPKREETRGERIPIV